VFFGTTRRREADILKNGKTLASFSGEEGNKLILGTCIVTIPIEREKGTIPRPEIDLKILQINLRREDPGRDFTIAAVTVVSQAEFLEKLNHQLGAAKAFAGQAFIFVHGYSVGFDDAIFRTAQIAHDIGFDGPAITYTWPSRGGVWDYRHDIDTAKGSRNGLKELIELVARETEVQHINIIAHSMGSDPLLDVLRDYAAILQANGTIVNYKLQEILFAAPDVSRTVFEQGAEKLKGLAMGGITLYASTNDRALAASKAAASGLVRAGDIPSQGPLIIPDVVETIDVTNVSTSFFSINHSTFAERGHLVEDLRLLFELGKHPPDVRFNVFKIRGNPPKQYWDYLKN
jgi:esterase/lipase superfamily enzyme